MNSLIYSDIYCRTFILLLNYFGTYCYELLLRCPVTSFGYIWGEYVSLFQSEHVVSYCEEAGNIPLTWMRLICQLPCQKCCAQCVLAFLSALSIKKQFSEVDRRIMLLLGKTISNMLKLRWLSDYSFIRGIADVSEVVSWLWELRLLSRIFILRS